MAIDEQVELLKQGAGTWNAWRARQPEAAVDLSHGALRGLALEGAELSGADLSSADLRRSRHWTQAAWSDLFDVLI